MKMYEFVGNALHGEKKKEYIVEITSEHMS